MLGFNKWVVGDARANIRIETKSCACCDVKTLVTAPLRGSNRRLEKYPGAAERFPRTRLDTGIDTTQKHLLADFDLFDGDTCACCFNNMNGGCHDFWPD